MQRLLALTIGLVIAGVLASLLWNQLRPEPEVLTFVHIDPEVFEKASAEVSEQIEEGQFRKPLDEETVRKIMPMKGSRVYDPHCYFHYKPGLNVYRKWKAHPEGGFDTTTNSLGLRQDGELAEVAPDLRILLAGDSHTTGVCSNAETLAAQLEDRLAAHDPERSVEVVNGSHGAYSFFHYLGVLERMLALDIRPDLFVVVVYGGNDFRAVNLWHFFQGTKAQPSLTGEVQQLRRTAADKHSAAMGQVLSAAHHFAMRESEVELAMVMSDTVMGEMQRICAAEGIGLLVVYLPSPTEVPGQAELGRVERGREFLGLEPADLARLGEMGDLLLDQLDARAIPRVDLREAFREQEGLLYWPADLHLNLEGQALGADVVAPWVEDWWRARQG